jgi:hypothetical protein
MLHFICGKYGFDLRRLVYDSRPGAAVIYEYILLNNCIQRPTNLETGKSLSDEIHHDNAVRCEKA